MLRDADVALQEQAWSIVRNLAEDEEGIEMVFQEMKTDILLDTLANALNLPDTASRPIDVVGATDVTLQVCTCSCLSETYF